MMCASTCVVEALGATVLLGLETLLRFFCIWLHFSRWQRCGSGWECVTVAWKCDDVDQVIFRQIFNQSQATIQEGDDAAPVSRTCFIKSLNESTFCQIQRPDFNTTFSTKEEWIPVESVAPSTALFYHEFGALVFSLDCIFLLLSKICFILGDIQKMTKTGERSRTKIISHSDKIVPLKCFFLYFRHILVCLECFFTFFCLLCHLGTKQMSKWIRRIPAFLNLLGYLHRLQLHLQWLCRAIYCAYQMKPDSTLRRNHRSETIRRQEKTWKNRNKKGGRRRSMENDEFNDISSVKPTLDMRRKTSHICHRCNASREKAKCSSILEVFFGCAFFAAINLYLIVLHHSDLSLLEFAALAATLLLLFYQTRIQGFFGAIASETNSKPLFYSFLRFCLLVLIVTFAIYFSSEAIDAYGRKCFNPFLLLLLHFFFYFSLK